MLQVVAIKTLPKITVAFVFSVLVWPIRTSLFFRAIFGRSATTALISSTEFSWDLICSMLSALYFLRGTLGFTHKPGRKNSRTTLLYINLQVSLSAVSYPTPFT